MKYEWIVEIDDDESFHLEDAKWKQEIVRCKDCKYYINGECNHIGMKGTNIGVSAEMWFCADGERKEDETIHS